MQYYCPGRNRTGIGCPIAGSTCYDPAQHRGVTQPIRRIGSCRKINVSVSEVEVKNEEGKKENVTPDDITKQETDIDPDLTPEDWTTGNEEDIEIGTKEDFITPGGQANDWQQGEDEQVTFDSTNLQFR